MPTTSVNILSEMFADMFERQQIELNNVCSCKGFIHPGKKTIYQGIMGKINNASLQQDTLTIENYTELYDWCDKSFVYFFKNDMHKDKVNTSDRPKNLTFLMKYKRSLLSQIVGNSIEINVFQGILDDIGCAAVDEPLTNETKNELHIWVERTWTFFFESTNDTKRKLPFSLKDVQLQNDVTCSSNAQICNVPVNTECYYGQSALHAACFNGHLEGVRFLVNNCKANVDGQDIDGSTALYYASSRGHLEIVKFLSVECNAHTNTECYHGQAALHAACSNGHLEVVRFLVNNGKANVDLQDKDGCTALYRASSKGHFDTVKFLINECSARVNTECHNGQTVLHAACSNGHLEVVRLLVKGEVKVNVQDRDGCTALHSASSKGHLAIVKFLTRECNAHVERKRLDGQIALHATALYHACSIGHLEIVKFLTTECDAHVNMESYSGQTALNVACSNGHLEVVRFLVNNCQANVDGQDSDGSTSLYYASAAGHLDIVEFLTTECNALVDTKCFNGQTALQAACIYSHLDVVRFLVNDGGANIDLKDKDGWTALDYISGSSKEHLNIVQFLTMKRGDAVAPNGNTLQEVSRKEAVLKISFPDAAPAPVKVHCDVFESLRIELDSVGIDPGKKIIYEGIMGKVQNATLRNIVNEGDRELYYWCERTFLYFFKPGMSLKGKNHRSKWPSLTSSMKSTRSLLRQNAGHSCKMMIFEGILNDIGYAGVNGQLTNETKEELYVWIEKTWVFFFENSMDTKRKSPFNLKNDQNNDSGSNGSSPDNTNPPNNTTNLDGSLSNCGSRNDCGSNYSSQYYDTDEPKGNSHRNNDTKQRTDDNDEIRESDYTTSSDDKGKDIDGGDFPTIHVASRSYISMDEYNVQDRSLSCSLTVDNTSIPDNGIICKMTDLEVSDIGEVDRIANELPSINVQKDPLQVESLTDNKIEADKKNYDYGIGALNKSNCCYRISNTFRRFIRRIQSPFHKTFTETKSPLRMVVESKSSTPNVSDWAPSRDEVSKSKDQVTAALLPFLFTENSEKKSKVSTVGNEYGFTTSDESTTATMTKSADCDLVQPLGMHPTRPACYLPNDLIFTPSINGRNGWDFENIYDMSAELGRGAFGAVYMATHRMATNSASRRNFAIKQTRPNLLDLRDGRVIRSYDDLEIYCEEIKVLVHLRQGSPRTSNVLHLYEYYLGGPDVYLITELLDQDLDEWRQECEVFTERMAIDISRSILSSLKFISERNVVHRDIKLQNILFKSSNDFKSLKLIDFGLSRILGENEQVRDFCGSVGYIAPEMYRCQSYRFEVDMFSFGVLLFRLLSAERPFPNTNSLILRRHTLESRYSVIGTAWENVTDSAKNLVRKLLINRFERLTAEQALAHPWFSTPGDSILRAGLSHLNERSYNRSEGFLLHEDPIFEPSMDPSDSRQYWIDASVQKALETLFMHGIYNARIIHHADRHDQVMHGMIQVEEIISPITSPVAVYISRFNTYNEKDCRAICREITTCIQRMHEAGIAHRNLHLANVEIDPFGKVSVKGLKFVQLILENQPLTGHFGYEYEWYAFKAPEIDSEFVHDKSVDLWSLGVMIYMLLTGLCPFRGGGLDLISAKHRGDYDFDVVVPSRQAQELVRGLLEVDVSLRFTIDQVLNHAWMIEADDYLERFELDLAKCNLSEW